LSFVSCTRVNVNGIRSGQNTGVGVLVHDSTDVELCNVYTESNTGAGLTETGTSDGNTFGNLRSYDDGAVPSIVGAQSAIVSQVLDDVRSRGTPSNHFRADRNSANQTVTAGSFQKVLFNNVAFQTGGDFDTVNGRWAPPKGRYRISASCLLAATNIVVGQEYVLAIYKNGGATGGKVGTTVRAQSIATLGLSVTGLVDADGDDFFEVYVYAGGAGDKTVNGDTAYTTFEGEEI
jgi:hypothetical protein